MKESVYFLKILIVSADPDISNVVGTLLNNLDYTIELTNSGAEALKQLKTNQFDLMLLDSMLPDMNAIQILNYLKGISGKTLVIVMLGEASFINAGECLQNGAYDYLKKPLTREEIRARVKNALYQRRQEKELEDITGLIQVNEERNCFIQNSNDIIYTLDYEGRFTSINDSLQQKLGYENNFLMRKHFSTIIYPDDMQKAMFIFNERRSASRDTESAKIRLIKHSSPNFPSNGNYITVEVKARGIYDRDIKEKGKLFLGTYGIARDISEFIKNEDMLKLQKIYFRELFDNSCHAEVILDTDCRVLNANKTFERLFQYSQEDIKYHSIHDLIIPEYLKHKEQSITDSIDMRESYNIESIRKSKYGENIDVLIHGYPIFYNNKHIGAYQIYSDITDEKQNEREFNTNLKKIRESLGNIANAMVSTIEVRDPYTVGHQQRVSNLARAIANKMGLPREEIDAVRLAGTLHDLGKVNIPAEILSRPGKLSNIELNLIKTHPTIAYDILNKIEFPWEIAEIIYQHHERLDGSGYPLGLKANEISLGGRILSVADVVESMSSHRPYRPAPGLRKALEEITCKKDITYDSKVVDACTGLFLERDFTFESDLSEENGNNYQYFYA